MFNLPRQVWLLTACFALMSSVGSLAGLVAGIIGAKLAPTADLATLPVALFVIGLATMALPAGQLGMLYGRKRVFIGFTALSVVSALFASWSLTQSSFIGFCVANFLMGGSMAAVHQYRFAAIEAVAPAQIPLATSTLMLGGIVAAVLGPELGLLGQHWLTTEFAGSFLLLAIVFAISAVIMSRHRNTQTRLHAQVSPPLSLEDIISSPVLVLAIGSAAIGYGIMTFVMTATPISMHNHFGHSLTDAKTVIQIHMAAMFLPSLISGWLLNRIGFRMMFWIGLAAYLCCLIVALSDTQFFNFWVALLLLGVGWNFLYVGGTALLPLGYKRSQGLRAQAINDFIIFSCQAVGALSSGWFLFHWQWRGILLACLPVLAIYAILLLRSRGFSRVS